MKKLLIPTIFALFGILLFLGVKGLKGNPTASDLNNLTWRDNGPLELSPERGRFALVYSLVEDHSFYFSADLARFVVPDLGFKNGHYVSLFAPAVSYLAIPGYIIGKYFGASQTGTFATSALFALLDGGLIYLIAKKLGANKIASLLSVLTFLFATPSFAYSGTLYEHHISTFVILLALYLLNWDSLWALAGIWFLAAASIPIDYPNLFLMIPIGLFALGKIILLESKDRKINLKIKPVKILSFLGILLPLGFFLWFNLHSYGNPLQFSGTVGSVKAVDANGNPAVPKSEDPENVNALLNPDSQKKSIVTWFQTRNLLNGFYIHIFSPDRGIIYFTPVILLGLIGGFMLYRKDNKYVIIMTAIIGSDLIFYSMWGDPWGGWAFGSRYMIPAYAILAILISIVLTKLGKKLFFVIPFLLLLLYSIGVNTLGAVTANTNPPQAESLALEVLSHKQERYSFDRNWEYLTTKGSKAFVYQAFGKNHLTAVDYYYLVAGSVAVLAVGLTTALLLNKNEKS